MSAHFGVDSTINRLKEHYIWPKMYKDVEKFKRHCESCIRNDKILEMNHPAITNKATHVNDEIVFDFSWGYDTKINGEIGVMYIQEVVSRFTKKYAMKTKSSDDIAKNLINWVCIF